MSKKNSPIRILHTEWSDGWGGQEIRILNEMLALRELGVEPLLACRKESIIYQKAKESNIPVYPLSFRGNTDIKTLLGLIRVIKKEQIDIVNTHSGKDTWVGGFAAKLTGKKFIRTRHLSNPIRSSRLNFINELADFIFTTGESVREDMIKNNRIDPNKILSIPTGVDEKQFNPKCCEYEEVRNSLNIPKESFVIGNLAVLRSFKRHDILIEAFERFYEINPNSLLLIAGEGPQRDKLEKLIEKKSLQECVKLLGYQEKPQYFLKALDLFVLSSDSKEGVPQSLIQALMMGLPSIATDVGSVKDLYKRDNFILVSPNSIESLNQKMIELYKDQNQRETLAKKAPSSIKEFTQDSMANRIYKIYKMLLEK